MTPRSLPFLAMTLVATGTLTACSEAAPRCEAATLAPLPEAPAYAVVTSLFHQSSAIGLLNANLSLATEAWVDSGTHPAGVTSSLGGDVALPTTASPGELVIIERIGVDTLTRIAVPSGEVLAQIPVQTHDAGGAAYRANPQDAIRLDEHTFLVSRHEPNLDAKAAPENRGNDLVVLDADTGKILDRVDLSPLNTTVDGTTIYARPARMVAVDGLVVVGLARLARKFDVVGPGAVAVVDVYHHTAAKVDLPGLTNCGEVHTVLDEPHSVSVLCAGNTFSTAAERRKGAGIAVVSLDQGSAPTVTATFHAKDHPDMPPPQLGLISLGDSRFVVASLLTDDDRTDALLAVNVASDSVSVVTTTTLNGDHAQLGFDLGVGRFDVATATVMVPSATEGILRYALAEDGTLAAKDTLNPSPCRGLPVRELGDLRP